MLVSLMFAAWAAGRPEGYTIGADGLPVVADDLGAPFPVDPEVRWGVLPNGLTWYVEHNERPARRAELRMIVRVGSIVESEGERGIAHYLEHMAFNGSKHFPADSAITSIERFGARFGAHVNASTGFDETVYQLQVPTDDPKALDTALQVFADQAGALEFDPLECAREVGVVTEEWRLDQGLPQRVQDQIFPLFFHGSPYPERMPIGTTDREPRFSCDVAKAFWERWYRPDLMAVAVVGDVDIGRVQGLIKRRFGRLRAPADAVERPYYRIGDHAEPLISVFADPEVTDSSVMLMDKVDDIEHAEHRAYRELFLEQMAYIAINERLAALVQDPGAPFVVAYADISELGHERAGQTLNISAKEGRELEALEAALSVVERARRHGFTDGEIERARRQVALGLHEYFTERETTDSSTHIEEIVRVFTTGEPMPGIAYEYAMSRAYLPGISRGEVEAWARDRIFVGKSRVVSMILPKKYGLGTPSAHAVRSVLAAVATKEFEPPADEGAERPLVEQPPQRGSSEKVAEDPVLGTTTWRLSNGATVILKPTELQADEILLEAFSPGGSSVVPDGDYIPAITATGIQRRSGLGDHDTLDLLRHLTGRKADLDAYIGGLYEGMSGMAGGADLELMLQQVHLMFTAPRFDASALELERARREEDLRNRTSSPEAWLWDTYAELLWQGNERYTNWDLEDVAALDLAKSEAVFRDRFSNPGDWTFVFVGSTGAAEILPLVETWIGGLPDGGRRETPRDDGGRMVPGVVNRTVAAGGTPRAHVVLDFHGDAESTPTSRNVMSALGEVLQSALREELREDRGGTYGVSVDASLDDGPHETYQVRIDFECDPERVDELIKAMWDVVELVRRERVLDTGIQVMRSQRSHDRETDEGSNAFWASEIAGALQRGEDPGDVMRFEQRTAELSGAAIREMARQVLTPDRYLLMVQRPDANE